MPELGVADEPEVPVVLLPVVLLPEAPVESVPLIVPDWPLEVPRFRRERERVVVELELLSEFWSMVVLDWPVCEALDCPLGELLVALAPEL